MAQRPLVGFYGDDFTGSSENLAQFHRHGLRARLYFHARARARLLAEAAELDVIGFAGTARSLAPDEMAAELADPFSLLAELSPRLVQYKICSTFDSSPTVGNFGKAIEIAGRFFPGCAVPVLAATPDFGRFTAFSQHFARFGPEVFRLDRHPSMSRHPATPMREADLRRHLALQTSVGFSPVTLSDLARPEQAFALAQQAFARGEGVVFDTVDNTQLGIVCRMIWAISAERRLFALAAQGLAQGLGEHLASSEAQDRLRPVETRLPPAERVLVLSGSCALQTARQLDAAERAGWLLRHLPPDRLLEGAARHATVQHLAGTVTEALAAGRPVAIHTARTRDHVLGGSGGAAFPPDVIGAAFAALARTVRERTALRRIVFAGGDSSSHAMRAIGADALEIAVFDEAQSTHLCRLRAEGDPLDGLEVMLKGGQVGEEDYFLRAWRGTGA